MDFKQPSQDLLLELINTDSGRNFTQADIDFGKPVELTGARTEVLLTAKSDSPGYRGTRTVRYDRLHLGEVVTNQDPDAVVMLPDDGYINSTELADRINRQFNLGLSPDEIVAAPINITSFPHPVSLTVHGDSLVWRGQANFELQPVRPYLTELFEDTHLPGFDFPSQDVSHLSDPVVGVDLDTSFSDDDGHFYYGDIPIAGFTLCSNGELEIGACARRNGGMAAVHPSAEGNYTLNLTSESSWSIPISIGTISPDAAALRDLYEVCLEIQCPDNTLLKLTLVEEAGNYKWVHPTFPIVIDDDYLMVDETVYQTIIEMTPLKPYLGDHLVSAAGAPLGVYVIRLSARRLDSVASRLLITFIVRALNG